MEFLYTSFSQWCVLCSQFIEEPTIHYHTILVLPHVHMYAAFAEYLQHINV